ncbi:telomere-associated protein RIF1 [Chelonus insularis]|uniref:telomere-associated protein RIF1 n=1 Tax=Chelonus insularis TaxID=460826 RepID=UPI00158CE76D|nr:telomere-associated protein RIF1 [Chelonus insularis]
MTLTSYNIIEVLDKLRSNNSVNDTVAILTYINSDIGRMNLLKTMNSTQHLELCQLLVDFVIKDDDSKKNKDLLKSDQTAEQALEKILKDMTCEINFFEIISKIDRNKRLKIFKFLKTLNDDVILRISKDYFTVKYLEDCLKAATPETMEWLKPSACIDDIQLLLKAEEKSPTDLEDQLVLNCLDYLVRIYGLAIADSNFHIEQFHLLIFEKVIPLTYMGHKKQRTFALKLLNRAVRIYFEEYIREQHKKALDLYKCDLQKHYCIRMLSLVKAKQSDWCYLWCFSLEIVGADLFHGADLINDLLLVEEKAFKSNDMTIRHQAFISWKSLINIFASNPTHFVVARRIKLLCIPLNSKNSKTETIAVTKLEVWWHLIVKLYPYLETFSNEVIFQFLNFCFGPLGETPLLSTKCDLASAGKRFIKARVYAVDALLQLLVVDEKERREVSLVLDEKIPYAVTNSLFEKNYKSFVHSVGEAVLIISNLEDQNEEKKINLNKILWLNLMKYIQQANSDIKIKLNKELILVIGEIINHLEDSSLISNLLLNIILPELIKAPESFMHRDTTLIDLLTKILLPKLLVKIEKIHWSDIKLLVCYGIKAENMTIYNPNVLILLKALTNQMQIAIECQANDCFIVELWCMLAESITKYISDNQKINENTTTSHNFETVLTLISFPLKNVCFNTSDQLPKIVKIWRELYKEFNMQADLITTVKFNEILNNVSEMMSNCLLQEPKCYIFISHCLSTLMSTIHYGELLKQESIPPIVILLRDVTSTALSFIKNSSEIEYTLKAISSFIITVYGLNQEKIIIYLGIINSTIENMLKIKAPESIQKEIINTWETVVLIFRGLFKMLTFNFLNLYRETIKLGLLHANAEIASETLSLIDIKKDLDDKSRDLLENIESEAKKMMNTKKISREVKNDTVVNITKPVKVIGSFFNRQFTSSKVVSTKKDKGKKIMPPPPEPDSQEYVVINNEIKVNVNLLTEHQKECFKQHKDDIPAMYNDLSQSGSCNTQELENWFKDKGTNLETKVTSVDNDANKENKNDITTDLSGDKISYMNYLPKMTCSNADKVNNDTQVIDEKHDEINPEGGDSDIDKNNENNQVPENVAKKLNFESREEFPDDNDPTNNNQHQVKGITRRSGRRTSNTFTESHRKSEELQLPRVRTRSSKLNDKISTELDAVTTNNTKGIKRKTADEDSDRELTAKRRRHTIIPVDSNENQMQLAKIGNQDDTVNLPDDPNLPKRTKKEISRLKIDMVFDSKMTSKLRSKPSDDYVYDTTTKRHSTENKSRQKNIKVDKHELLNEPNHELLNKRRRRDSKSNQQSKNESIEHSKSETVILKNNEDGKEFTDSEKDSDKSFLEKDDSNEKSINNHIENGMKISSSPTEISTIVTTDKQQMTLEDEVIESSQESSLIENSLKKNDKKLIITNDKSDISPLPSARKDLQHSPLLTTSSTKSSSSENIKTHQSKELPSEEVLISKSLEPKMYILKSKENNKKNIIIPYLSPKEKSKLKFKNYSSNGRAAHMLNLVTKQVIGEKSKLGKLSGEAEEEKNEQETTKEMNFDKEIDTLGMKKETLGLFKDSERMSSPIGHRQEKIFNNMKAGNCSSPPPKLFCNLKNDGEKISPKMEKSAKKINKLYDHDYTEMKEDSSISFEKELPILEWSSANPPSLTASPSSSILKKQRQALLDPDIDTTPTHKRKRVSFADPPVSKQMGYEIISDMSPSKSKLGSSYSFPVRKGTPYRSRQLKWKIIEIPTDKQNDFSNGNEVDNQDQKDIDFTNISITMEEQYKDIEESIVGPMEVDFNFTDNSLHLIKGLNNNDNELINDLVTENQPDISIEVSTTQQDVFHEDEKRDTKKSNGKDNNDSTIMKIINGSIEEKESEALEDTVDIQNISNLTANSDDLENKSIKLNSSNVVIDNLAECDTLPLTDSVFLSQGSIQSTHVSLKSESVNEKDYIYSELLDCEMPIEMIIPHLVNPLWKKNLIKYFNTKHINTIGDLARLTEQDVIQIPLNKNSKVNYVKKILDEFSRSLKSKQKYTNNLEIVNETKESPSFNDSVDISSLTPSVQPSDDLNITEVLTNQTPDKVSGSYGSIILDTSISPPKKTSTELINQIQESPVQKVSIGVSTDSSVFTNTQTVETQVMLEELLDELDSNLVLENGIKRNNHERVLEVLEKQSPNIRHKVLKRYLTPDYIVSYVKDEKIPKKDLLSIYEAISTQLPAIEWADIIAEDLKKKNPAS